VFKHTCAMAVLQLADAEAVPDAPTDAQTQSDTAAAAAAAAVVCSINLGHA